jgi:anti-sigma regulatory factor (Ser/Thr protein kinase)
MGTQSSTYLSPKADAHAVGTRLRRRPVRGSVVLGLMPTQPQPQAAWANVYPVSDKAPRLGRLDTEMFLAHCSAIPDDAGETALLIVSELVTNAYKAMRDGAFSGIACIELSLRLFTDHLLIEVIDSSRTPPVPQPADDAEAEGGRGLAVVDALSREWGYFFRTGRKVVYVWCPLTPPPAGRELPGPARGAAGRDRGRAGTGESRRVRPRADRERGAEAR